MDYKQIKYALLMIFDYKVDERSLSPNLFVEHKPTSLLSMFTDLKSIYDLSKNTFKIPEENITIITDINPSDNEKYPWIMKQNNKNVNLIKLKYPDIEIITKAMAQFIENTIRGIKETIVYKGENIKHQILFYLSGHGSMFNSHETALIFMKRKENVLQRCYLHRDEIFNILFGKLHVNNNGLMKIKCYNRNVDINSLKWNFEEDSFYVKLLPINSKRNSYEINRGIPLDTEMLVLIDTCHSSTITNFPYIYDGKTMIKRTDIKNKYPICISIGASQDISNAPSTIRGSPFTESICTIFKNLKYSVSIKTFYNILYSTIPQILEESKPTITSTIDDPNQQIPFLDSFEKEEDEEIILKNINKIPKSFNKYFPSSLPSTPIYNS
jgi:hypothetical protein